MSDLPPCGIYRTLRALGDVPAGRLVYFHNHGEPGPGLYLPERWTANRAEFTTRGFLLPAPFDLHAAALEAIAPEGFYRVREAFFCCAKKCREFTPGLFVQLGYDGNAEPIVFTPELSPHGILLPPSGSVIGRAEVGKLEPLTVTAAPAAPGTKPAKSHLH